jgi:hypothetical protein
MQEDPQEDTSSGSDIGTVAEIRTMSDAEKNTIKARLTTAQRESLAVEQKAALNIDNTPIQVEGNVDEEYGEQTFETFVNSKTGQSAIQIKSRQQDRWYTIYKAHGFTGVVHGWELYKKYVAQGGSHASGEKADNREDAEYKWLVAFYKNNGCINNMS